MFSHAMADLETFGLRRGNALRSIAIIPFDPFTGFIADREFWFYQNVNWESQEAVGLTKDEKTVEWWNQPEQAEAQALLEPDQETLTASLMYLDRYLRRYFDESFRLWSRGMMDQEVLEGAYDAIKREKPWHFRSPRDTRGFLDLVEFSEFFFPPDFVGIPHFGPDDALHECHAINRVFEHCNLRQFGLFDAEFSGIAEATEGDQAQKFADIAGIAENQATMTQLATGSPHCQSDPQMPEGWEPANKSVGDPVGQYQGSWGHWDETWSEWYGGHADEEAARKALQVYCDTVLG